MAFPDPAHVAPEPDPGAEVNSAMKGRPDMNDSKPYGPDRVPPKASRKNCDARPHNVARFNSRADGCLPFKNGSKVGMGEDSNVNKKRLLRHISMWALTIYGMFVFLFWLSGKTDENARERDVDAAVARMVARHDALPKSEGKVSAGQLFIDFCTSDNQARLDAKYRGKFFDITVYEFVILNDGDGYYLLSPGRNNPQVKIHFSKAELPKIVNLVSGTKHGETIRGEIVGTERDFASSHGIVVLVRKGVVSPN